MEYEQKKFNDLNREFLEDFISKLPKTDKLLLKQYIENHPRDSSSAMFAMVKSYIYNTYFRAKSQVNNNQKVGTFADTLDLLLMDVDTDDEEK